jgi:hypothetical protein
MKRTISPAYILDGHEAVKARSGGAVGHDSRGS